MLPPQRSVASKGRPPVQNLHEKRRITGNSLRNRILFARSNVFGVDGPGTAGPRILENNMNRRLIRYNAKPDRADENQRLIEAVFLELREKKPEGVRYMVLRMADDSFAHFVELEGAANPLQALESFRKFSGTAAERALDPPVASEARVIGDYRMLEKT
jgi:hypothetical protein